MLDFMAKYLRQHSFHVRYQSTEIILYQRVGSFSLYQSPGTSQESCFKINGHLLKGSLHIFPNTKVLLYDGSCRHLSWMPYSSPMGCTPFQQHQIHLLTRAKGQSCLPCSLSQLDSYFPLSASLKTGSFWQVKVTQKKSEYDTQRWHYYF